MSAKLLKLLFLAFLFLVFQACSKDGDNLNSSPTDLSQLSKIEAVLRGDDHALIALLNNVRGSVGKRGTGSKTIWSRKNDYGLGLYISANHVYNIRGWTSRNAEYFDIASSNTGVFETSQIPPVNGNADLGNILIADFPLMHFDISTSATNRTILPSEDFFLGIIDNQRVKQNLLAQIPNLVQTNVPLEMYDPNSRTKNNKTWNNPKAGENAIVIGYPQNVKSYPNGAVALGKILSDAEAEAKITQLHAAGDSEGDIPYNSSVEFFVEAHALPGMSGGGAFNSEGQLLGIIVRASDTKNAPRIIRAVRISYIKSKMMEFYNSLSQTDKDKLRPFIDGEIEIIENN